MSGASVWPKRLVFQRRAQTLAIEFTDGSSRAVGFKHLRENSPSAAVRGHGAGPAPPQAPVPDDISVLRAEPVGRYAVRIVFSDGHDSGLYTWDLLSELAL
ncbi:MAG: DUF971 domain-containing protein [Pseudomonadota bacterium]